MRLNEIFRGHGDFDDEDYGHGGHNRIEIMLIAPGHYPEEHSDSSAEVALDVDYSVEPTELEGGHVSTHGGVEIEDVTVAKPFMFMGQQYKAGIKFPKALEKYVDGSLKAHLDAFEKSVHIPTHHYPAHR